MQTHKSQHWPAQEYQKVTKTDMTITCHLLLILKTTCTKIFGTEFLMTDVMLSLVLFEFR